MKKPLADPSEWNARLHALERDAQLVKSALGDLTRQLEGCEREESRAYQALLHELSHLDRQLALAIERTQQGHDGLAAQQAALETALGRAAALESEMGAMASSLEMLGGNVGSAMSTLTAIAGEVGSIEDSLGAFQQDVSVMGSSFSQLGLRLDAAESALAQTSGSIGGVSQSLATVEGRVGEAEVRLTQVENLAQSAQSTADQAKTTATQAQNAANQAQSAAQAAALQTSQLSSSVNNLAGAASHYDARIAELESQLTASFHPATPVETSEGLLPIGQMEPGMRVWRPVPYGRVVWMALETVLDVVRISPRDGALFRVTLQDGMSLMATPHHRFAVLTATGLRLLPVRKLEPAMRLMAYRRHGRLGLRRGLKIQKIERLRYEGEVCNLRLPHRQFLVGGGVLAH